MKRKSELERIAALEARIEALKARAAARADPTPRHVKKVLRAIDSALDALEGSEARAALERARAVLEPFGPERGHLQSAARAARRTRAPAADLSEALLAHVKRNPGQRGEEIASALGTDTRTMRPTMRRLIDGGKVRTEGRNRGTSYFPR